MRKQEYDTRRWLNHEGGSSKSDSPHITGPHRWVTPTKIWSWKWDSYLWQLYTELWEKKKILSYCTKRLLLHNRTDLSHSECMYKVGRQLWTLFPSNEHHPHSSNTTPIQFQLFFSFKRGTWTSYHGTMPKITCNYLHFTSGVMSLNDNMEQCKKSLTLDKADFHSF